MNTLVSIIVPVYNAEAYIQRCINSITAQTYKNIEIILVDDGSTDVSLELCRKKAHGDNRIVVIHQENKGVVVARTTGMEKSQGQYLMFVDADDWIEADMVEELLSGIGEADIISAGVFWEKYPGIENVMKDDYTEGLYDTPDKKTLFFNRMIFDIDKHKLQPLTPWSCNKLYKREIAMGVYQTFDNTIAFAEDTPFIYKCFFKAKSFVIKHKPFYHYCYNEKSVCHSVKKNILIDINKVYLALFEDCSIRQKEERLLEQLQIWITLLVRGALNEKMQFDFAKVHISEFLLDTRLLKADTQRVVVYGAGQAGQDFCHQLRKLGYEIVLWVDSQYEYWRKLGHDVSCPAEICISDYDEILIAVFSEKIATEISNYLVDLGIVQEKIKWGKPIVL